MISTFLHIPITPIVQEYMTEHEEVTEVWLIKKFYTLLENEIEATHIKNAFQQVEEIKKWNVKLEDAREFLNKLND